MSEETEVTIKLTTRKMDQSCIRFLDTLIERERLNQEVHICKDLHIKTLEYLTDSNIDHEIFHTIRV